MLPLSTHSSYFPLPLSVIHSNKNHKPDLFSRILIFSLLIYLTVAICSLTQSLACHIVERLSLSFSLSHVTLFAASLFFMHSIVIITINIFQACRSRALHVHLCYGMEGLLCNAFHAGAVYFYPSSYVKLRICALVWL